jgi:CheY-like chemotaxis protein/HPt (histidine-containing phosphotransfer) domain-containing protein
VPEVVNGDRARLRQVLLNLLSNAVKFTDEGEVVVRVRRTTDARRLHFSVSDTGVGIDEQEASRLFESFVQADQSTTRKYGGTGLGLAISRQLVLRMGGEIGARPRAEGGSTFWFEAELPRVAGQGRVSASATELRGLRALVVDDNATNRTALEHHLRAWGLECESAERPSAALERLERAAVSEQPFDLAVLDFNLPEMNGIELARTIRDRTPLGGLKLVLLASSPVERSSAAGLEIAAFLTKPVRQADLRDALAGTSQRHEAPAVAPAVAPTSKPVLIAEDNEINCAVAQALLAKRGLRCEIARNGRQAVESAASGDYAAIFMDCHMPELDGFDATREIRRRENGRRVPIIAMTALSMAGDRERCLAAGMDDYLAKPLRSDRLQEVVERWIAEEDGPQTPAPTQTTSNAHAPGAQEADAEAPLQSVEVLEDATVGQLQSVEVLEDATVGQLEETLPPEMREQLLGSFDEQLSRCLEEIESAAESADHDELKRVAHLLKGSSATFGASRLRAICQRLERAGAQGEVAPSRHELDQLRASAEEARVALHARLL